MAWRSRVVGALALSALLTVSACGDDDGGSDGSASPTVPATTAGGPTVDEAFVDAIKNCERLLVTPEQVSAAFGIQAQAPAPFEAGGVLFGCEYATPDKDEGGGQLVVSAYTADDPSAILRGSRAVEGIGDEAQFRFGPQAVLQVRSGDLVLRFTAGGTQLFDRIGLGDRALPPLRSIAEQALAALEEGA
jgi:hypothetical protein